MISIKEHIEKIEYVVEWETEQHHLTEDDPYDTRDYRN